MAKLRKRGKERRVISFEKDIVEDAFHRLEGKYSRGLIQRVYRAQISYFLDLLAFTDVTEVYVPFLGLLKVNLGRMEYRAFKLKMRKRKRGCLSPDLQKELEALESRISEIKKAKEDKKIDWGDLYIKNYLYYIKTLKAGIGFENLQNFQEDKFKNT